MIKTRITRRCPKIGGTWEQECPWTKNEECISQHIMHLLTLYVIAKKQPWHLIIPFHFATVYVKLYQIMCQKDRWSITLLHSKKMCWCVCVTLALRHRHWYHTSMCDTLPPIHATCTLVAVKKFKLCNNKLLSVDIINVTELYNGLCHKFSHIIPTYNLYIEST